MKNVLSLLLMLGTAGLLAAAPAHAVTPDPTTATTKAEKVKKARKTSGLMAKIRQKQAKQQQPAYVRALQRNELFR
ncbi:hypothetical protein [Hymenobacter rubripertinctus]|uniref:Uncharacterized protein n=1 Tax=Hymenobacter rubripertinctus TaxID=2029981 RepID=A0A418QRT5_9BACT|nr:hypothetical protein [Hymenobacter rubripertinctus]RIY07812.1 hypothetical protein D0T11_15665 [Hymenobacter rubripertinctus]